MADPSGVVFPTSGADGDRSTSALGRAVVADALRSVDPSGARAAETQTGWRRAYLGHFRRLVEAGLGSGDAARQIAADGLASLHDRMRVVRPGGEEVALREAFAGPASEVLGTEQVRGTGDPERELTLPYRGERLRGDALHRRLDAWVADGVVEASCAQAVREVAAHPEWLDTSDVQVVVLGAGAEMGPVHALLRWGGSVVALDLPRPALWSRVLEAAGRSAGTLRLPVRGDGRPLPERAGVDLLHDLPAVAAWLQALEGRLLLGNYVYADGATHVRVATAVDALTEQVRRARPDTALSFLATPTDVFAVPGDAVEHSGRQWGGRGRTASLLRLVSGGRLLHPNYAPGSDPGVNDSLVPQQGPNYALAKRVQRWRATTARAQGTVVSLHVAPPTRTRSVLKNRALAAAYAGAHRFGVEVFEPATSNTLMAALLVHDLRTGPAAAEHPWQDEARGAAHGGLWRTAYSPRSALGLAAVLGVGAVRG